MKRVVLNYLVIAALMVAAVCMSCGGSGSRSGSSGGKGSGKIKMTTELGGYFRFLLDGSGVATVDWGDGSEKASLTLPKYFDHTYPNATIRTVTINGDNITKLNCQDITGLDVSRCTELTNLQCIGSITSLDVSKNTALTELDLRCWQLSSLDVSKNTALTQLFVSGGLTSLDVRRNTALTALDVSYNKLTATALNTLFGTLHSNTVPPVQGFLNESKNQVLTALKNTYKQLGTATLNAEFGSLHSNTALLAQSSGYDIAKIIKIGNNPGTADCDRTIAEKKGWTVREN